MSYGSDLLRLTLQGFCHINLSLHPACIYFLWLLHSDETVSTKAVLRTLGLARDFTDTNSSEYFLASVMVIGEEHGRRKEEHIKYIPEPFRELLFLNRFTN